MDGRDEHADCEVAPHAAFDERAVDAAEVAVLQPGDVEVRSREDARVVTGTPALEGRDRRDAVGRDEPARFEVEALGEVLDGGEAGEAELAEAGDDDVGVHAVVAHLERG